MAENGYGMAGHIGRIPNYGKTQVNPMGSVEPPACIQNAMMTKDKKPFTYTPGGLDLSQIRTPSMARRLARQRSDEQERVYTPQNMNNGGNYNPQGGPAPPPPPPPPTKIPAPPPPPPLIIEAPNAKAVKPVPLGERPEIVIPENPIGMLRKTNSPYHWEVEKAEMQRMGPVPKFVEKVPSPLTVKLPQQQMQQTYSPPGQNMQRQNYPYNNQNNQAPESPIYRPEAQYRNQRVNSANVNGSPQTREMLVRQDSQFNKSPQPFEGQSPLSNGTPYSPTPNNNWRQPEKRDSPANKTSSPLSQQGNRGPFSPGTQQSSPNYSNQTPPAFHTLPRVSQRSQEPVSSNFQQPPVQQNTSVDQSNYAPWRTNTLNRYPRGSENQSNNVTNQTANQQQAYSPPWKSNDSNNNRAENSYNPPWKQENKVNSQQQYTPPWVSNQDANNNRIQENSNVNWRNQDNTLNRTNPMTTNSQEQPLYQSSISIPVYGNQRKQNSQPEYKSSPQKEAVYVNQEPVFYCPDSPKTMPPWVKTQKEKTKTPPPAWCNRPLEPRRSITRDLVTPPRDVNQEPEWVKKSSEMQRGAQEQGSPPKYQQTAQPNWSTRPSENRKSLPKDNSSSTTGARIIPIQMEVSSTETRNQAKQGDRQQPQLRIVIDMKQNPDNGHAQAPYSQPTQRIMRVLSPQLVRIDDDSRPTQHELPTLNRHFSQDGQPKTRIIPIQIESGNGGANKSFGGRY
ncbi:PREDICTED: putative uncharacterized protein DDB_G0285119 [Papilio xuthus]|uniref:Uncharacterized protein n=1 Tax=Papilio xuthus TaxID=66420 RepID=A0AAJ6Z6C4_PAPXU|nr:PREDICTED: putative uncharacterized protein DDB_G0285119 [Papilio xuthus]